MTATHCLPFSCVKPMLPLCPASVVSACRGLRLFQQAAFPLFACRSFLFPLAVFGVLISGKQVKQIQKNSSKAKQGCTVLLHVVLDKCLDARVRLAGISLEAGGISRKCGTLRCGLVTVAGGL